MCERFVGLVRVSTTRQGESGLGLGAGLADLDSYVRSTGAELVTTLQEVESGTHDDLIDRPTLLRALKLCKKHKAALLVPKLDRLARSTIVHADIKRSGVKVRAADNPHATELVVDIQIAVAADEARRISQRTRDALRTYKAERRVSKRIRAMYPEGVPQDVADATAGRLGSALVGCRLTDEGRDRGRDKVNAAKKREAMDAYAHLVPDMKRWLREGLSLRAIAQRLNERPATDDDSTTRTAERWSHVQVRRILTRAGVPTSRTTDD